MISDFTSDAYRRLVSSFIERGYVAAEYSRVDPGSSQIVLRHDIDMSLSAALPIAEIENELGVRATYFILMRSEFYNPFTKASVSAIERIRELGHDIGLHFDASRHAPDDHGLDAGAESECRILEDFFGLQIQAISFHRPAKQLLGRPGLLAGRRHAYEPQFFKEIGYCSDSRGKWHYGHPLEHPAVADGRALQLLTHPLWWSDPAARPAEKLDRFLRHRYQIIDKSLAEECDVHVAGRDIE